MTTTNESKATRIKQRLYIGGLNPDYLSPEVVFERICADEALQGKVEVLSRSASTTPFSSSTYFHFEASSRDHDTSALELVRRRYNNVMWKCSRLKVELAKPHILERLKLERKATKEKFSSADTIETVGATPYSIPRHLKLKRGYGKESWRIDTKPFLATDATSFTVIRKKQLAMEKRNRQSRAILVRFEDGDQDVEGAIPSDHSSTSSGSSISVEPDRVGPERAHNRKGRYCWSDSDESSIESSKEPDLYHHEIRTAPTKEQVDTSISIDEDVDKNMSVLGSLFPEMTAIKAESYAREERQPLNDYTMIRFDPTKASAASLMVKGETDHEGNNLDEEMPTSNVVPSHEDAGPENNKEQESDSDLDDEMPTSDVVPSHEVNPASVYNQAQLEKVFQGTSANEEDNAKKAEGDFSFSFPFFPQENPVSISAIQPPKADMIAMETEDDAVNLPVQSNAREESASSCIAPCKRSHRQSLIYPREDIDHYLQLFLEANSEPAGDAPGGPNSAMSDEWEKQRRILTQDWKGKRKVVQLQRRKRMLNE